MFLRYYHLYYHVYHHMPNHMYRTTEVEYLFCSGGTFGQNPQAWEEYKRFIRETTDDWARESTNLLGAYWERLTGDDVEMRKAAAAAFVVGGHTYTRARPHVRTSARPHMHMHSRTQGACSCAHKAPTHSHEYTYVIPRRATSSQ